MKDSNGQIHLVPNDASPTKKKISKSRKESLGAPNKKKGSNSNSKMEVLYADSYPTNENVINYKDVGKNISKFKRLEKEIENEYL